jgi:hypothetical protein
MTSDRLNDLLTQRATEAPAETEQSELDELLRGRPDVDADAFDRAAAAVHLAVLPRGEFLPAALRKTLEDDAARYFNSDPDVASDANVVQLGRPAPTARTAHYWPWLATAAALLLAITGWWPGFEPSTLTLPEQRAALIEQGASRVGWTATDDPSATNASGDVVWSQNNQEGFMLFRGLLSNEPSSFQYQLWIFDADRDERFPVDGGVFDIQPGADEVIIPVRPNIPVGQAVLFAVTVEVPGGVVVSDRERIAVVAELG